jgi:hypothetical protein
LAKPGLSGLSSNSCEQTLQTLIGNAIQLHDTTEREATGHDTTEHDTTGRDADPVAAGEFVIPV